MIAEPPVRRLPRLTVTSPRLTAAIALALLVFALLPSLRHGLILLGYLGLVVATCVALRVSRREPGSWLGRRSVRRVVVGLIGVVCLTLVIATADSPSTSASGYFGWILVLIILNVALGTATGRAATAPETAVDERQEALRNRAHRLAYLIFAVLVGGTVLVADVASPQSRSWLGSAIGGGAQFAFLELLFVLPGMVLAFIDPGYQAADLRDLRAARRGTRRGRVTSTLLALTLAIPVVLSAGLVVFPVSTTATQQTPTELQPAASQSTTSAVHRCREFLATRDIGIGVEAHLTLHAEACWDGRRAVERYGMNAGDCLMASYQVAIVTTTQCTRSTSAAGTLSFTYSSDIASALLPFLHREVTLQVVVDRNGTVERFP